MKSYLFPSALLVLTFASCQQQIDSPVLPDNAFQLVAVQDPGDDTKTIISGETSVYWEPAEEIKVFKADGTGYLFKSSNTEPAATAVFSGVLTTDDVTEGEELWSVYPFAEEATFDGESITTVLPSSQVARAESFGRNMNLSIARTTSRQLQFYNVGGGIRFSVTQEGISKVIFEGLNGEILSGKVTVGFENGRPVVKEVSGGSPFITLTPPDGETFQTGKWYFIVTIPGALSGGYKLRFYKADDYARRVSDTPVTIKRGIYGSLARADASIEYESTTTSFPESEEEIEKSIDNTIDLIDSVTQIIEQNTSVEGDYDIQSIVQLIESIENVQSTTVIDSGNSITIKQTDGVHINYLLSRQDIQQNNDNDDSGFAVFTNKAKANSIVTPTGKSALILAPCQDEFGDDLVHIKGYLNNAGFSVSVFENEDADISKFRGDFLKNFDVIYIATHGSSVGMTAYGNASESYLVTGTKYDKDFISYYSDQIIVANKNMTRFAVNTHILDDTEFNNSFILLGVCQSSGFAQAFYDHHAGAAIGFSENVDNSLAVTYASGLYYLLCCGQSLSEAHNLLIQSANNSPEARSFLLNYCKVYTDLATPFHFLDPTPYNLNANVTDDQVDFSWEQTESSGDYRFSIVINGYSYYVGSDKEYTLYFDPGEYSWYIQASLIAGDETIASYKSEEESFTIEQQKVDKPVKSIRLTTDYPGAYFNEVYLSFVYDAQKRLTGFSGGDGSNTVTNSFTYSGNSMTYTDNATATLNSQGQFSSLTWYGFTIYFGYDSGGRLTSISAGDEGINYTWKGNDLYSITYSDPSYYEYGSPTNQHFVSSSYYAPTTGVDINLAMRIMLSETGFEGWFPDGGFLPAIPGLIGKRSEHVLGLQFDDFESPVDYVGNFSQYKGKDGNWYSLTPNSLYNWSAGYGSFEVKGSNVKCKLKCQPWSWTADSDGAVTGGKWPLSISYGNITGTLVVSEGTEDRNGDGRITMSDATYTIQNGRVSSITSTNNYSLNFTFTY